MSGPKATGDQIENEIMNLAWAHLPSVWSHNHPLPPSVTHSYRPLFEATKSTEPTPILYLFRQSTAWVLSISCEERSATINHALQNAHKKNHWGFPKSNNVQIGNMQ